MQSTRHDANLAALHASSGLPGSVVDVVVLTSDTGLLATLREASGPEHAIWPAASPDTAVDLLVGGRCGVLIADLGTLRTDAAALLDRLGAQFPELILLATGRREEEGTVANLISKGLIYRFLHKPISPARASLFLSAATRRYQELRNVEPVAMTTVRTTAMRPHLGKYVAIALVLLAAVVGFFLWNSADESSETVPTRQTSERTTEEQVAELLGSGEMAYATGRYNEPRGDNALAYFRAALKLQPNNVDAKNGVSRVVAVLEARVREALQARNAPQGAIALTALQRAEPDHPQLDALRGELVAISRSARPVLSSQAATPQAAKASVPASASATSAERAAALATKAPVAHAAAAKKDVADSVASRSESAQQSAAEPSADDLAAAVKLRERGALVDPPGNNAFEAVLSLRDQFPKSEAVASEQQRLAFVLLDSSRTALAADNLEQAESYLSAADMLVPGMTVVKSLQDKLDAAKEERAFMRNVVQAGTLKRVKEIAAEYPRDAERTGMEGWVDVEFTIAPDGTTQDLTVRAAEPAGTFDKSALESVARWRFAPIVKNGEAVRQRAVLRVRFVVRGR